MQFREALAKVCAEPVAEDGAFLTYAKLCDLCGNNYESGKKIALFYWIDQKLSVVYHIQSNGKQAVPVLRAAYPAVKDKISQEKFNALIAIAEAAILNPKAVGNRPQKPAKQVVAVVVKKNRPAPKVINPNNRATPRLSVGSHSPVRKETPPASPRKQTKPTTTPAAKGTSKPPQATKKKKGRSFLIFKQSKENIDKRVIYFACFCCYLVGMFFLYRAVDAIEPAIWAKWLIGIATVIVTLLFIIAGIMIYVDCDDALIKNLGILFGITLFVNIFCIALFRNETAFLTACITPVFVISTGIFCFFYLLGEHNTLSIIFLLECFAASIAFAAVFSFPPALQWVVGIILSGLLIVYISISYDDVIGDYCLPAVSALLFLVANVIATILFKEYGAVISRWIATTCTVLSAYHIYHCFDEYEPQFGIFAICNTVLGVGEFILSFLLTSL